MFNLCEWWDPVIVMIMMMMVMLTRQGWQGTTWQVHTLRNWVNGDFTGLLILPFYFSKKSPQFSFTETESLNPPFSNQKQQQKLKKTIMN